MTDLFDFLRKVLYRAQLTYDQDTHPVNFSTEEVTWLKGFMSNDDAFIHFKSHKTGRMITMDLPMPLGVLDDENVGEQIPGITEQPEVITNFAIGGEDVDVFCIMSDAMLLNPKFQEIVRGALKFIDEHVPNCPTCQNQHNPGGTCPPADTWQFSNDPKK